MSISLDIIDVDKLISEMTTDGQCRIQDGCGETYRKFVDKMFPRDLFERKTVKRWTNMSYEEDGATFEIDEIIATISKSLNNSGSCGIYLDLVDEEHIFMMLKRGGQVYRVESYHDEYLPRICKFLDWEKTIRNFFIFKGQSLMQLWTSLFTVSEILEYNSFCSAINIKTITRKT